MMRPEPIVATEENREELQAALNSLREPWILAATQHYVPIIQVDGCKRYITCKEDLEEVVTEIEVALSLVPE